MAYQEQNTHIATVLAMLAALLLVAVMVSALLQGLRFIRAGRPGIGFILIVALSISASAAFWLIFGAAELSQAGTDTQLYCDSAYLDATLHGVPDDSTLSPGARSCRSVSQARLLGAGAFIAVGSLGLAWSRTLFKRISRGPGQAGF